MLKSVDSPSRVKIWFYAWLPFLPLSLIVLVAHGEYAPLLMLAAGMLAAVVPRLPRRLFVALLIFGVAAGGITGGYMLWRSPGLWQVPPTSVNLQSAITRETIAGEQGPMRTAGATFAYLHPRGSGPVALETAVRLISGSPGWGWHTYHPAFELQLQQDEATNFLSVKPPAATEPGRYIAQQKHFTEALAGRTFRARIQLRSSHQFAGSDCQGLRLQAVGVAGRGACSNVNLTSDWTEFEVVWQADNDVESQILRLSLHNIDVPHYDLRGASLEENLNGNWTFISPLEPSGVTVFVDNGGPRQTVLPKSDSWTNLTLELVPEAETASVQTISVFAQIEPGTEVALSGMAIKPVQGVTPTWSFPPVARLAFWFPHQNLAAHAAVVWTAILVAVAPVRLTTAVLPVSLLVILMTGSRSGMLAGVLLAIMHLFRFSRAAAFRWRGVALLLTVAAGLIVFLYAAPTTRIFQLSDGNAASRLMIWHAALHGMADAPLTGQGTNAFVTYWDSFAPPSGAPSPHHAHNLWLQFGFSYGLPGLFAITWLCAAIIRLAWQRAGSRGLLLVLPIMVLNLVDFTFFYAWIFYPLIMSIGLLSHEE